MKYKKSLKIIELLGCILIIVGVFLPLITASLWGSSADVSYKESTDGIVVLILASFTIVLLLIELIVNGKCHREKKVLEGIVNYTPILLLIVGVVFFTIDIINTFSDAKLYSLTLTLKVGFYMLVIGFILGIITLIYERFIAKQTFKSAKQLGSANIQNNISNSQNMNTNPTNNLVNAMAVNQVNNMVDNQNVGVSPVTQENIVPPVASSLPNETNINQVNNMMDNQNVSVSPVTQENVNTVSNDLNQYVSQEELNDLNDLSSNNFDILDDGEIKTDVSSQEQEVLLPNTPQEEKQSNNLN